LFLKFIEIYKGSETGHVAVFFALLALPLLIISGVAIDMQSSNSERVRLSSALDSAALAAVTNQGLNDQERSAYAKKVFWDNIREEGQSIDLTVLESKDARVALKATADIPMTFGILDDDGKISITEHAAAELTYGDVVCMLALAPKGERAFEVTGGARLKAPKCSIQVNSIDVRAAVIDHGGEALAQNFCVSGGAKGAFDPFVNTECRPLADPFLEKRYEKADRCVDKNKLNQKLSSWQAESIGVTLYPGTYCDGLYLYNKNVTFSPGVYVMKDGPFILDHGTNVHAEDVTVVLQGEKAVFKVNEGTKGYFKAPATGQFAGLAFFQDTHTGSKNFKTLPTGEMSIARGSNITVVGIVYLPEQKLAFRGGSLLKNQAPATSFIGYQISIGDGSNVQVSVDHAAAGIPPIEPRTDESARLTR
jgi:hypothetical protein